MVVFENRSEASLVTAIHGTTENHHFRTTTAQIATDPTD
jgi:hypothetical protein